MWSKLCLANKLEASASMSQRLVLTSTLALQTRQRCVSCSQMLCESYISRNALNVHVTHVSTGRSYRADRPAIGLCCSIMIQFSKSNSYVKMQPPFDISRAEVASEIDEQVSAVIVVYISTHDLTCMAFSPALVGLAIHQAPSEAQSMLNLYLKQFTLWTGVRNGVGMQD